ncbi:hypothetical protein CYMTET_53958 [Cymbomonas tetramitiformis]|uniref:Uncharacterized protein n=1 Tax=Cymbomonas tetramitiformis TaxID=36881 RepID=A0AAE0EQ27_9CHLO|nr:hypothetical protein CYMTET_53958 [Cymbomonas tetramitiformis]
MRSTLSLALSRSVHVRKAHQYKRLPSLCTTGSKHRITSAVPLTSRFHFGTHPVQHFRAAQIKSCTGRFNSTVCSSSEDTAGTYVSYIQDTAAVFSPKLLPELLNVLQAQGQELVPPSQRAGLHPLVIPLSCDPETKEVTGLLRWASAPDPDQDLPVVRTTTCGLVLLAQTAAQYVHRAMVDEDLKSGEGAVRAAVGSAAEALYPVGDAVSAPRPEVYITTKVGKFPDTVEQLAQAHLDKGDEVSSLVTGEFYQRVVPGWARSPAHHAMLLKINNRPDEARDQARVALCSPWWTLAPYTYADMAELAGFADKAVEWVHDTLHAEMAIRDAQQAGIPVPAGQDVERSPEQIALDDIEAMMNLMSADSNCNWDRIRADLVEKYMQAGMIKVARFIQAAGN